MAEEWSMSPEAADALTEEARHGCHIASERVPEPSDWGMYVYGDASPAIGGGVGGFLWFADRPAMLDYVKRLLTFLSPGPVSVDWGRVARTVEAIVGDVERDKIPLATGQVRLNKAMKQFSQVEWWGTFGKLLSGDEPFAKSCRAEFRDADGEDVDDEASEPIASDEVEEFLEYLRTYGV